jgi:hypothetical protein
MTVLTEHETSQLPLQTKDFLHRVANPKSYEGATGADNYLS